MALMILHIVYAYIQMNQLYPILFVDEQRELWCDFTAFTGQLYLIRFVDQQRKLWKDYTYMYTQIHTILPWSPITQIHLQMCRESSVRLHICTNSSEHSLVTYSSYGIKMSSDGSVETTHMHRLI